MFFRQPYPFGVSDEEWALAAPRLTLLLRMPGSVNTRCGGCSPACDIGCAQDATGESVDLVHVDQGYTGERPAQAAADHGITLEVVKSPEAKRGFVLLPRQKLTAPDAPRTKSSSLLI